MKLKVTDLIRIHNTLIKSMKKYLFYKECEVTFVLEESRIVYEIAIKKFDDNHKRKIFVSHFPTVKTFEIHSSYGIVNLVCHEKDLSEQLFKMYAYANLKIILSDIALLSGEISASDLHNMQTELKKLNERVLSTSH